jgi:hypothetical protein
MPFWFAMSSLRFFFDNMNRYLEKKGINLCLIKSFDNTFAMLANWSTASLRIWCLASSPLERISRAMNDSESSWPKSWASYPKSLFTIRIYFHCNHYIFIIVIIMGHLDHLCKDEISSILFS